MAETKVGPAGWLIPESSLVFNRDLKATEIAHEIAIATTRFLVANADAFLNQYGAIWKFVISMSQFG